MKKNIIMCSFLIHSIFLNASLTDLHCFSSEAVLCSVPRIPTPFAFSRLNSQHNNDEEEEMHDLSLTASLSSMSDDDKDDDLEQRKCNETPLEYPLEKILTEREKERLNYRNQWVQEHLMDAKVATDLVISESLQDIQSKNEIAATGTSAIVAQTMVTIGLDTPEYVNDTVIVPRVSITPRTFLSDHKMFLITTAVATTVTIYVATFTQKGRTVVAAVKELLKRH
ncbi:MAG TPA: hypothetical protein VLG50_03400 [Candidatus Saccharimonadales bacterium]|nr:hypothetical protein [Candidatus Saccharimonadales bacterium]